MAVPLQVQLIEAFGAGVYALTLASHADLWWRRREQRSHAWLALSAFGALLVNLTGAAIRVAPAAYATALLGLNMLGVAVALISLYELAEAIGGKRPGRLARAMEAATLVPILLLPVLPHAVLLAALYLTGVLFLLAAIWVSGRQVHSTRGRWAWVVLCGVVGWPALASLWLLYPRREPLPVASPTLA